MKLTDILSNEEWIIFANELSERFNINCNVYDKFGAGFNDIPRWCNRLCPKIKANKDSFTDICLSSNQYFMVKAERTRKPVVGECDAGLIKIAVPIFFEETFLGISGGCGLLPVDGEVESFMIEKLLGLSEQEVAGLCWDMGTMTEAQALEMIAFIEKRIQQFIGEMKNRPISEQAKRFEQVQKFIGNWSDDALGVKPIFMSFYQDLRNKAEAEIEFYERPGISYSLRGIQQNDNSRPLFVMVDVIDDDPKRRWLSVCFYGDTIKDPDELGDLIPGGLLGSDGYCFDITESDNHLHEYIRQRIQEAYEIGK